MSLKFYKYQGSGNDFIIFDFLKADKEANFAPQLIRKLCSRRKSIGADGLIVMAKSDIADFKMLYYNSDGKPSTMCGNGGRCVARLFLDLKYGSKTCTFEAPDGLHTATLVGQLIALTMKDVDSYTCDAKDNYIIDSGSPHFIHFTQNISSLDDIVDFGRSVRNSDRFVEEGINVNMVINEPEDEITMATYERGVENETLSCGTGVVAAALAKSLKFNTSSPIKVHTKGGDLEVSFKRESNAFKNIVLQGPAEYIYTGHLDVIII